MSHIFISYSKKNKAYARNLADQLIAAGFDIWIDDRIDYGSLWEEAIQKAVEHCAAMVVIMTPESRASQWVRTECEYAAQQAKPVFPLLLSGEVFFRYVSVQYVNVTDGSLPPDAFLDELAEHAPRKQGAGKDVTPPEVSEDKATLPQTIRVSVGATHKQAEGLPSPPQSSPPPLRRRAPLVIGVGVLAALILLALVVIVSQPGSGKFQYGQTRVDRLTEDAPALSYTFTGEAGDFVVITLVSEDFDPFLILLDADGGEIAQDDDSADNQDARIGPFILPADGDYTIVAQSLAYRNGETAATGGYSLILEQLQTEAIEYGETVQGSVTTAIPALGYTFSGAAGDSVVISLISEDFDPFLILLDADGGEIAEDDDSADNQDARIGPFTLPAPGDYIIVAQSFAYRSGSRDATGEYSLTLERIEQGVVSEEVPTSVAEEQAGDCQYDWFFGDENAVEGDCPVSNAIEFNGLVQRFEDGVTLGIRIPSGDGQFAFLTNAGIFYGRVGDWDLSAAPVASCPLESTTGVMNTLPVENYADELIGCPVEPVQLGTFNFQISDSSSEYAVYIGTSDGVVYRLAAPSSTADEGEWQQVR